MKWDLSLWANKLNNGMENLKLECGTLTAREEKILKDRLKTIDEFSEQITNHLEIPVKKYTEDGISQILEIQNRMLTFLVECESDSNIYNRWHHILTYSHNQLTKLIARVNELNLT